MPKTLFELSMLAMPISFCIWLLEVGAKFPWAIGLAFTIWFTWNQVSISAAIKELGHLDQDNMQDVANCALEFEMRNWPWIASSYLLVPVIFYVAKALA